MDAMHVAETVTVQAGTSLGDGAAVLDSIIEQVSATSNVAETQVGATGPSAAAPEAGIATMGAIHVAETVTVQAGTSLGDGAAVPDGQVIAMAETQVGDTPLLRAAGCGATPLELGTSSRSFSKRVFVSGTILNSANPDISGKYFLQALYSRFDKKDDIYAVVIAIDATSRAAFDIDIQNPFFRSVWSDLSEPRNGTLCKTYSANAGPRTRVQCESGYTE
jgi:predicted RNA-binding protein with TRAM domain